MVRVGLFLAAEPFDGGAFQYSQSVLYALTHDLPENLTTVVIYTSDVWRDAVNQYAAEQIEVRLSSFDRVLLNLVKFGFIPSSIWSAIAHKVHGLTRVMLDQECDVWVFPSQDAWSYFFPVRSVVSIFDLMHRYERRFREVTRGFKYLRRERHYKKICCRAAGLLVDSAVGKQQVEESYIVKSESVYVLPFTAPLHLHGAAKADAVNPGLPEKYFFYPAQFWMHKNHIRLIRAIAGLVGRCPDIQLLLAGSKKNNYVRVSGLIEELGLSENIRILGYVSDQQIASLYRNARALVMPTFFGPTNIPPLEAMAIGCPVAASNIYAMPEQLGGAGLLFDPASVEDIRQVLYRLWTDDSLCSELSRKGRERAALWTQTDFSKRLHQIVITAAPERQSHI